jgi:hypothetical protein
MSKLVNTTRLRFKSDSQISQMILGYFGAQVLDGAQVNEFKGKPLV